MSAFSDLVTTGSPEPDIYWRLGESAGAAGPIDTMGTLPTGTYHNGVSLEAVGRIDDGDTCALFDGADDYASIANTSASGLAFEAGTLMLFPSQSAAQTATRCLWSWYVDSGTYCAVEQTSTGHIRVRNNFGGGGEMVVLATSDPVDLGAIQSIALVWDEWTPAIYVDGVSVSHTSSGYNYSSGSYNTGTHYLGCFAGTSDFFDGRIDEVMYDGFSVWNSTRIAAIHAAAGDPPSTASPNTLPLSLSGFILVAATSLPLRLLGMSQTAASSLPLRLEAPDPAHFTASAARFGALVVLGGTDISARLTGPIRIVHEETASASCVLEITPESGALDPADYERKRLEVSFVGLDSAGATLYTRRRFTGITSTATHDPDSGTLTIEATTDLQGLLENLPRAAIDALLPGSRWSEHVFDEGADGWQYAQHRLSTLPSEMHIDEYGHFVVSPFARKATADVALTDSDRFDGALKPERANRRDLLTRIRVNFDFRFVRLRHRELGVHLVDSLGFCDYLNRGWELPSKDMVRSAADSGEWTRIGDISYTDLPGAGSYCNPLRGWTGNAQAFCLGAYWRAARRWAQTVTEEYALDIVCSDLEEAVGRIGIEEDYGLEAIYDATDYERIETYSAPPTGAVLSGATADWMLDATEVEAGGRAELEDAVECVVAKAQTEILSRARSNRVPLSPVYRPDLSLSMTAEVDTPYLACTGKIARIEETIDPSGGVLEQSIEIALSRHGGSGLAVTDAPAAPDEPAAPAETPTPRHYYMQYRIGGTTNAVPDDEDWDGYITNVAPVLRDPAAPVYQTRFVVRMPEIEESARDAVAVQAVQTFGVAVPQDPLTIGV